MLLKSGRFVYCPITFTAFGGYRNRTNNFTKRWMSIKAIFTKRFLAARGSEGRRNQSRKRTGEAAVWQQRFWELWSGMKTTSADILTTSTTILWSMVTSNGHTIGNGRAIIAIENRDIIRRIGALPNHILFGMEVLENKWSPQNGGVRPHPCILLLVYFITTSFLLSESMNVNRAVSRSSHPRVFGARR